MHDGCATFFKKSAFECESVVPVEYFVPGVASLDRDNVALLLLLQPKYQLPSEKQTPVAKLCIANTHLLFNPRRGDVKLAQLMKLFAEIDRLTYQPCPVGPAHRNHYPVLICGDMNLEPFSQLYWFIRSGNMVLNGQSAARMSGQQQTWSSGYKRPMLAGFLGQQASLTDQCQYISVCQERFNKAPSQTDDTLCTDDVPVDSISDSEKPIFSQGSGIITHKFGFDSVYRHHIPVDNNRGQPNRRKSVREVTTYHTRANCTVDYIFYTPSVSAVNHRENDRSSSSASKTIDAASDDQSSDRHQGKLSASDAAPTLASSNENVSTVSQESSVENAACEVTDYKLMLLARLQLLTSREMKEIGRLPNQFISSDHLILAAQFLLTNGH